MLVTIVIFYFDFNPSNISNIVLKWWYPVRDTLFWQPNGQRRDYLLKPTQQQKGDDALIGGGYIRMHVLYNDH